MESTLLGEGYEALPARIEEARASSRTSSVPTPLVV